MPFFYDLGIGLYHAGIRAAVPFNSKARSWLTGRKNIWERLSAKASVLNGCIWMHCASVGEFEQGLPVLEALKKDHPTTPILVTFFSPSGFEARKNHPIADHVDYLPADGEQNAEKMLGLIAPTVAIFVKYEFWSYHLHALKKRRVPTYLIAATFRKDQPFFKWFGSAHRAMLNCYDHFFVQDEESKDLLRELGRTNVTVAGDTRFDRVAKIVADPPDLPIVEAFVGNEKTLVCGSTWPADEKLILAATGDHKVIIVPHELTDHHLDGIEENFPRPIVRYSELEQSPIETVRAVLGNEKKGTLIIDRMGILARTYAYATIVYVGGGFGDGIHSLLEAAAWNKPVIFGPNHTKFIEAQGLVNAGGGYTIATAEQLKLISERLLLEHDAVRIAGEHAGNYVRDRIGATEHIHAVISDQRAH